VRRGTCHGQPLLAFLRLVTTPRGVPAPAEHGGSLEPGGCLAGGPGVGSGAHASPRRGSSAASWSGTGLELNSTDGDLRESPW